MVCNRNSSFPYAICLAAQSHPFTNSNQPLRVNLKCAVHITKWIWMPLAGHPSTNSINNGLLLRWTVNIMPSNGAFVLLVTGGRWAEYDGRTCPVEWAAVAGTEPEGPVKRQEGANILQEPLDMRAKCFILFLEGQFNVSGSFFIYYPCPLLPDVHREVQNISGYLIVRHL